MANSPEVVWNLTESLSESEPELIHLLYKDSLYLSSNNEVLGYAMTAADPFCLEEGSLCTYNFADLLYTPHYIYL